MENLKITYWEFDDNGNLAVETQTPEMAQAIDKVVKQISSSNILSRVINLKETAENAISTVGYFFSVHEFKTIDIAKYIDTNEPGAGLTEDRLFLTSRLNVPKTVKTIYIKTGKKQTYLFGKPNDAESEETPVNVVRTLAPADENPKEDAALSFQQEGEVMYQSIMSTNPNFPEVIRIRDGQIKYGGYAVTVHPEDTSALLDIIETIFPDEYQPQSQFIDRTNSLFVFSKNEFDVYNMLQLQLGEVDGQPALVHTDEIFVHDIIDNRLPTINRPKEWAFKGLIVPDDYDLIIDGQLVECKVVLPKKEFNIFDDTKPGDFLAFSSGTIGCVSEVHDDSIILAYYRYGETEKFVNEQIVLDKSYIQSYNGHLATEQEMELLKDAMIEQGYTIDPITHAAVKKYPWLNKNVVYYMPVFDQEIYDFVCQKNIFSGTKRAYIDIYASKTPIFNNHEECLALVEKYNESMTDIEKDSDILTA